MKKKFLWIAALFAALSLIVIGCPTGGGGGDDDGDKKTETVEFWLASDDLGTPLGKDTVTLTGDAENEQYVYIFFTPLGRIFNTIKVDYTFGEAGVGFNMRWQCTYDDTGTWGAVYTNDNFIGWMEQGPSECDPAIMFVNAWGATGTALDKTTMKGLCLAVSVPAGSEANFKFLGGELIGLGSGGDNGNGGGDGEPLTVFGGGTLGTGVTIVANEKGITHSVSGGKIVVNRDTTNDEFRLQVAISPAVDISGLSDFVLDFDLDGENTLGGANISIFTSDSKKAGVAGWGKSSPAKYNFTSDHQSWLGVAVSETNGQCTGFEIYSDSEGSVLSINSIKFE